MPESSACIFGYDTHLQAKDIFLIFDFGGGTLDVSIVQIEEEVEGGKGCRTLGKAGCSIGGRTIDGWIYKDILDRAGIHDIDARSASALFMIEVEKIKTALTNNTQCEYDIKHKSSGLHLKGVYHRSELEDLMEKNECYYNVNETLDRALNDARERGITKENIKEVLVVGGTSQIPSIRRQISMRFGSRTKTYRPYDAVARGACRYLTQGIESLYDHIQHDYAIKSYNSKTGTHHFIPLVPRGTDYPTKADFKKFTLKAVRDGQRFMGIDIFEVAEKGSVPTSSMGELIFDPSGGIVFENHVQEAEAGTEFWMNEDNPTFIEADPPGTRGEPRFSVVLSVDAQKRLLLTVRDIKTQRLLYQNHPVVKLK